MAAATGHDIIVIGASAGGIEAVSALVAQLLAALPVGRDHRVGEAAILMHSQKVVIPAQAGIY